MRATLFLNKHIIQYIYNSYFSFLICFYFRKYKFLLFNKFLLLFLTFYYIIYYTYLDTSKLLEHKVRFE